MTKLKHCCLVGIKQMNRKEKEFELWQDWALNKNKRSRDELINSLSPLLNKEVNKYTSSPLPRPALETEARILATKALDSYDPNKAQLNTHVMNNLKHLQRYVLTYQNIGKIPEHRGIAIGKYQSTFDNLTEDLNREPTEVELADALGWNPKEVERMQSELRRDLNIVNKEDDTEDGGDFFDYSDLNKHDTLKDALMFVYYDSSAEDKKILEYTFGIGSKKIMSPAQIAGKLKKPESYIKRKLKLLAQEITNARL